jgi:dATP pyrophosphohydrolase
MARAPFQVIVFLFVRPTNSEPLYAILRRSRIATMWQAVSGGGEDAETPLEAAVRETFEETGVTGIDAWVRLDSRASVPSSVFSGTEHWPSDLFVVPEHAFGLEVPDTNIQLSSEHRECAWLPFYEAHRRLTWDSNKVALWELHCRVQGLSPRAVADPALAERAAAALADGAGPDSTFRALCRGLIDKQLTDAQIAALRSGARGVMPPRTRRSLETRWQESRRPCWTSLR